MKLKTASLIIGSILLGLALLITFIRGSISKQDGNTKDKELMNTPISIESTMPKTQQQSGNLSNSSNKVQLKDVPVFDVNFDEVEAELLKTNIILEGNVVTYVATLKFRVENKEILIDISMPRDDYLAIQKSKKIILAGGYSAKGSSYAIDIKNLKIY